MRNPAQPERKTPVAIKAIGAVLAAGSVLSVLAIVFIVMRSELRHRESECPFEELSLRTIDSKLSIREEARSCDTKTSERRFWLLREGNEPKLLGGRRLPKDHYEPSRYRWSVDEGERGVAITIENEGVESATFYELPPKRRER